MSWRIPTLANSCARVGAGVQLKQKRGKAPADCVRRDTMRLLARVLVERSLPLIYLKRRLRQVDAAARACRGGRRGDGDAISGIHRAECGGDPVHPGQVPSWPGNGCNTTSPGIMREPWCLRPA